MTNPIPVTILTGFLGAGKTTLLRHILHANHGHKIAVIENEFGAVAIDDAILGNNASTITTLANGCICCSSANELADSLLELLQALDNKEIAFERLVIECTGMANPGPVMQTFFSQPVLCERFLLDGVVTLVDAVYGKDQLAQFTVAQLQVGYADCLLLTKTDLAPESDELIELLRKINAKAPLHQVINGQIDLAQIFNLAGFELNADLKLPTKTLFYPANGEKQQVNSVVVELNKAVELSAISAFMEKLLLDYADNLLRYKGILAIANEPQKLVFQGVQRLYSADWVEPWGDLETPKSLMVFIGVNLPEDEIRAGFANL